MPGRGKGFTLVEIMIVVAIIGLLAAIAVPSYRRIRINSLAARTANDLRVYTSAFQRFNLEYGYWPPASDPGVLPEGMDDHINRKLFETQNPLGTMWKWEVYDHVVGLGMDPPASALAVLERVDSSIDDGSLGSGRLRIQSGSLAQSGDNSGSGGSGPSLPDNASKRAHEVIAKIFAGKNNGGDTSGDDAPAEGTGFIYVVDVNY